MMKVMKTRWLKLVVVAVVLLMPARAVSAVIPESEMNFYNLNNIRYYNRWDGNRCVESGASGTTEVDPSGIYVAGDDNASGIMGTLMVNGYTKQSAAAILGNLYAESRLNPRVLEGGSIVPENFRAYDNGQKTYTGGFGLVQWDYDARVRNLQAYADSHGLPVASVQAQVGFMIQELADPEYNFGPSRLNAMDLETAVQQVLHVYERPKIENYNERLGYARQYLGIDPGDLPEIVPEGYVGAGSPVTVDGVISFSQCDPTLGNLNYGHGGIYGSDGNSICQVGCGPTSFASIAATLGLSVTPAEVADVAGKAGMYVYGQGSSWAITRTLADHYGFTYEPVGSPSVERINSLLQSGKMIHVAGSGAMPYSSGGHYIGIVGMTNTGDWIVVDSGHGEGSAVMTYNPNQVLAGMHGGSAGAVGR